VSEEIWTELEVTVSRELVDAVANFLVELGSPGIVLQEGEKTTTLRAYLAEKAEERRQAVDRYLNGLMAMGLANEVPQIRVRLLEQTDWLAAWRDRLGPIRVGRRLLIRPSWVKEFPERGLVTIVIDPQMAFGTGEHPTTQFCLRALEDLVVDGQTVLDVGTGSGILSIAAAKMGAGRVLGLDTDPEAIATARRNACINGVSRRVEFSLRGAEEIPAGSRHLVVANIDGHTLLPLLGDLKGALLKKGHLVLAGFTLAEESSLRQRLAALGLKLKRIERRQEWVSVIAATTGSEG
jgi:ribosomal protein L11 methyltransferase